MDHVSLSILLWGAELAAILTRENQLCLMKNRGLKLRISRSISGALRGRRGRDHGRRQLETPGGDLVFVGQEKFRKQLEETRASAASSGR